jgi:hypothetical protein
MISMQALQTPQWGSFDITGTTGRKLLDGNLARGDAGFIVKICSEGKEDEPRAIVEVERGGAIKIYSKRDALFGILEPNRGDGRGYMLVCDGVQAINLEAVNLDALEMVASAMNGEPLASAGLATNKMWRLQVKPGADAVLIMSCMLSLIFSRSLAARSPGM